MSRRQKTRSSLSPSSGCGAQSATSSGPTAASMPSSSRTSRAAACAGVSPVSTWPPLHRQRSGGWSATHWVQAVAGKCDTCWVLSAGMGERIAVYRRRRGLSQAALAGLIGRSESWLSQVERGIRSVDRLSVLLDIARILHVDVESLIGRPWQLAPNGGAVAQGLDVVRQLPELIMLIDGIPRLAVADERRDALCIYVSAYVGAAKLLTKLGVTDLAVVAADRAAAIAVEADSLSARGMAAYQVVCALLREGHT